MATLNTDGIYTASTGEHTVGDIGVRPVGQATTSPTSMIQAIDALVTNTVAKSKETANVQHDAAAAMERAAHLLGGVVDKAAAVQGVRLPPTAPKRGTSQRGEGLGTGVGVSSDVPTTGSTLPTKADVIAHPDIPDAGAAHPTPALPHTIEGWRNYHLSDVRSGAARSVNKAISNWGTGAQQRYVTGMDANGQPMYATRAVPKGSPAEVGLGESPGARAEVVSGAKNFFGSLSEGGGIGDSLGAASPILGTVAGVGAGIYVGGNKLLDFMQSQRQANAQFQAALGGTNAEGFRERMGQNLFRLDQRGFMGGADAERIYQNAAELYGVNHSMRGQYQEAALNLYRNSGLNGSESTRLLDTAAASGNTDLMGFARAITEVGRAARDAGVGAAEGRKYFEQAYGTTTGFAAQGAGTAIAQTQAQQQLALGEQVAAGTDLTGTNTEIRRRMQAQSVGLSYAQYSAAINDPNRGAQVYAQGQTNLQLEAVQRGDPNSQLRNAAMQYLRQNSEHPDNPSQEDLDAAARYAQSVTNYDPRRAQGIIQATTGATVDEKDAVSTLIRYGIQPSSRAINQYNASQAPLQTVTGKAGATAAAKKALGDDYSGAASIVSHAKRDEHTGHAMYHREGVRQHVNWEKSIQADIALNAQQGHYYGVASKFGENYGKFQDANFKVKTADGERWVNASELVRFYSDQLQRDPSSIEISGGQNSGKSIGDVLGITRTDKSISVDSKGRTASERSKSPKGVGEKKSNRKSTETTVHITASPALLKLVHINASGSAFVDSAGYGEPAPANNSGPSIELGGN